ncbi:MAG: bifunctional 3'-5' exonuclease/DNA polymerase [Aquificae bacterium]|nr:bifunctional 3'-5' exonuclease/DNA polymerase [Aquificota bacterium]
MEFTYVTSNDELLEACRALEPAPLLFIDAETTPSGLPRLLQIASDRELFIFDLFELEELTPLRELIKRKPAVGHNLKFDLKVLKRLGLEPAAVFDTMIGAQLLGFKKLSLAHLTGALLGKPLDKSLQLSDWSAPALSREQLEYAARDALVLRELFPLIRDRLNALKGVRGEEVLKTAPARLFGLSSPVAVVEMAFVKELAEVELRGFPVDAALVNALERELTRELTKRVEEFIRRFRVDPFSPKKVARLLEERFGIVLPRTAKGNPSTDDAFLQEFAHREPVKLLLEIRRVKKLLEKLKELKEYAEDGRVHPEFRQIGAVTGRMACARPNLQNVPQALRAVFKAPEGRVLAVADFSQIELRIAAELVNEEIMTEAFKEGKDMHRLTAALVLGKPEEAVTETERKLAKALNFGLIYGISAQSLAHYARAGYGVELSEEEAKRIRRKFFNTFKAFARWHEEVKEKLRREGKVKGKTLLGRPYEADSFTDAVNYPVQGTGADLIKLSVLVFHAALKREGLEGGTVNLVHDEIVAEGREEDGERLLELLVRSMKRAGRIVLKRVPVEVEARLSKSWG